MGKKQFLPSALPLVCFEVISGCLVVTRGHCADLWPFWLYSCVYPYRILPGPGTRPVLGLRVGVSDILWQVALWNGIFVL